MERKRERRKRQRERERKKRIHIWQPTDMNMKLHHQPQRQSNSFITWQSKNIRIFMESICDHSSLFLCALRYHILQQQQRMNMSLWLTIIQKIQQKNIIRSERHGSFWLSLFMRCVLSVRVSVQSVYWCMNYESWMFCLISAHRLDFVNMCGFFIVLFLI